MNDNSRCAIDRAHVFAVKFLGQDLARNVLHF